VAKWPSGQVAKPAMVAAVGSPAQPADRAAPPHLQVIEPPT